MTEAASGGPSSADRYTATRPCPVCGGHERMPRGHGVRCEGYLFGDGAYCARDSAGKRHPSLELYWHRLHDRHSPDRDQHLVHGRRQAENASIRTVEVYDYTDESGKLVFQVVRQEPKNFPQRRPDGRGGWIWNLQGVTTDIYQLPEIVKALAAGDPIYITEGEKDANAVRAAGMPATTSPGGAKKWRARYAERFRNAPDVRVVADRDTDGYTHADRVAKSLRAVGATVRVFEAAAGKDPADHLAAGRTLEELVEIDPEKMLVGASTDDDEAPDYRLPLAAVAFTGEQLRALLQRPSPPPIFAGIPPVGHFTAILAPAITGKTSLELWLAMGITNGVSPWQGAPAFEPGRVLIYSLDEAPEQVIRRANGLAIFHPAGPIDGYLDRLFVIGPDRDRDPTLLEGLRFDEDGLATLSRWLEEATATGDPFSAVFIDAYADVLPLGESESSNEEATRIGGALERLAVRYGCAVVLLHHYGKPKADAGDEPDIRFLGRGASALIAKARTVFALEGVPGLVHLRRIRTATNLGRPPATVVFQVCDPTAGAEELLYFRPVDPYSDYKPAAFLREGEEISTNTLARRLAGEGLQEDQKPSGELKRLAAQLRERWREAGLVTVTEGPRNSKMLRIVSTGDTE